MRVHAFLATADELPALIEGGVAPATGAVLAGVDPVNLGLYLWVADGR